MARERRLHGDLGRLHVADLTHQDPVGILAEDRPEAGCERVADPGIDRHLHDAVDVVLDRVFRGDQLVVDLVELGKCRIEGRRLAGARRPGDEHDPVGPPHHLAKLPQHLRFHSDFVEIERHDTAVEHPHDHALAKQRGQHAHPEIDRVATDGELDPAVLRHPPLRDVEVGHHLDAGGDREGQVLRRRHHLLKHAVGLEADPKLRLEGLEVDVAGPVTNGQQQHHVEEFPHRGTLREGLDARQIGHPFLAGCSGRRRELGVALEIGDERFHALVLRHEELLDRLGDLGLGGHADVDVVAEQRSQLVGDLDLLRIGRRDREPVARKLQRHHAVELGHRLADEPNHLRGDRTVVERHEGGAPLLGKRLAELLVGVEAERDTDPAKQFAAPRRLLLEHRRQLVVVDEAEVDEDLTDPLECHGLGDRR